MAPAQCFYRHVQQREMIRHKECIELSTFKRLRELLETIEVEVRIGPRPRISPCRGVNAYRAHERAKPELSLIRAHGIGIELGVRRAVNHFLISCNRPAEVPLPREGVRGGACIR